MALVVGELAARLKLDKRDFDKGLDESEKKGGRFGGAIKQAGKVAAAGIAAVGAAAIGAAFKTAAYADETIKAARAAGLSTDAYQELRYALGQAGIDSDQFDKAAQRVTRTLGEAASGNDAAAKKFADLGVATHDATGALRSGDDVMNDVLASLAAIDNDAERAARASEIFGSKAGPEMAGALSQGIDGIDEARRRAHELGIVLGEETMKKAEQFNDSWEDVKLGLQGFLHQAGAPVMAFMADRLFPFMQGTLIPAIGRLAEWLGPRLSAAGRTVSDMFNRFVVPAIRALGDWWTANGPTIINAARAVADFISGRLSAAFRSIADWWAANGPQVVRTVEALRDGIRRAFDTVRSIIETAVGMWRSNTDRISGQTDGTFRTLQRIFGQIFEVVRITLDRVQATIQSVTGFVQRLWERWGDDITAFARRTWDNIRALIDAAIRAVSAVLEIVLGLITGDWRRAWDGVKDLLRAVWDAMRALVDQAINAVKTILTVALGAIASAWRDAWQRIRDVLTGVWDAMRDRVRDRIAAVRDTIAGALRAIGDAWQGGWQQIRDFLAGIWTGITSGARGAMDGLKSIVSGAVTAIGNIFDGVKQAFRRPLAWVVDNVINRFLSGVERIAGALNLSLNLGRITLPQFHRGGIVGAGAGDPHRGPIRPGERLAVLEDGEEVLTANDPRHRNNHTPGHAGDPIQPLEVGGPGIFDRVRGIVSDVAGSVRGLIAQTVRPVIEQVAGTINAGVSGFGTPGRLAGAAAHRVARGVLDWIAGVDREAASRETPSGPGGAALTAPGGTNAARLINAFRASGVPGRVTSVFRAGGTSLHGQNRAVDFAGPTPSATPTAAMGRIFDYFARYGGLRELIYNGRDWNILGGRRVGIGSVSAALRRAHNNHVHVGMRDGGRVQSAGWSWVGEDGPELAFQPRGAQVAPGDDLTRLLTSIDRKLDGLGHSHPVYMDTDRVGEALVGRVFQGQGIR
jgi:hypothetical protein